MDKELVKLIRYYKGMTQQEFAEFIGVKDSAIFDVEAGRRKVSSKFRADIAKVFDSTDPEFIAFVERHKALLSFGREFAE